MQRVVKAFRVTDIQKLIERIQQVGQRLISAQPRELAVGNIVRRVLGVIRDEAEEDRKEGMSSYSDADSDGRPQTPKENSTKMQQRPTLSSGISTFSPLRHGGMEPLEPSPQIGIHSDKHNGADGTEYSNRPPLLTSHVSYALNHSAPSTTSMFNLLSHPVSRATSPYTTPGSRSPKSHTLLTSNALAMLNAAKDIRSEVIEGIDEIIDELQQADDQIAGYALEHIHSNEIILTHSSSVTVQKFLLKAAGKRRFTVMHAEAFPNDHKATHEIISGKPADHQGEELKVDSFLKPLIAVGITVILIPDSAIFAVMSRVNKVILGTHIVLANGGLVATVGARAIAKAASVHRTPVVVLSGIYKLSPVYPFDFDALIEYGDASKVVEFQDSDLVDQVNVENPLFDYVPAELVDLYITNL